MWTVASSQFFMLASAACWSLRRWDLAAGAAITGFTSTACHLCGSLALAKGFRVIRAIDVSVARSLFVYGTLVYASPRVCACAFYGAFVYLSIARHGSWEGYAALRPPARVLLHCSIHAAFSLGIYLAACETAARENRQDL